MRYVVAIFVFCLPVVAAHAGTFVENFDDGDFDGWKIYDGGIAGAEWRIENGVAIGKAARDWNTGLLYGEDEWRNYGIECDVKMVQKLTGLPSVGLGLRVNKDGKDLVWCFYSGVWQSALIWTWINDTSAKQSVRKAFDLELGRWYRFKAIANEDDFEFYIDGELMASLNDPRLATGRAYVNACGSIGHFDNVVIAGEDVPGNTNLAAVHSADKLAVSWGQLRSR